MPHLDAGGESQANDAPRQCDSTQVPAESTRKPPAIDAGETVTAIGHHSVSRSTKNGDAPTTPGDLGQLAHYRILKEVGRGGMGVVYHAVNTSLDRQVAVKVILSDKWSPEAEQRFEREAKAIAKIDHDHVVRIHRFGRFKDMLYFEMPLLRGQSLETRLQAEKQLSLADAVKIGQETAEGLSAAHAAGLVHRDVKPANIFLSEEAGHWRVRLLDLGLAREQVADLHLTVTGWAVGTPAYMSPEQAEGKALNARSDLFGLGVVLYRVLTGSNPFSAATMGSTIVKIIRDQPPPVCQVRTEVPAALSKLIEDLMAKKPRNRPVSAMAVAGWLRTISEDLSPNTSAFLEAGVPPGKALRRRPRLFTALAKWGARLGLGRLRISFAIKVSVTFSILAALVLVGGYGLRLGDIDYSRFDPPDVARINESSKLEKHSVAAEPREKIPAPSFKVSPPSPKEVSPFPSETKKDIAALPRPSETKKDFAALPRPSETKKDFAALPRPSETKKDFAALPRPSATKKDIAALPRPSATKKDIAALPRPPLPPPDVPPAGAAKGLNVEIDLRFMKKDEAKRSYTLDEANVLPLKAGDATRIEVKSTVPAYFYVLNIDAAGKVWPLYPWRDNDWKNLVDEKPRLSVDIPDPKKAVELHTKLKPGPSGIEAALVLTRETPLTPAERAKLQGFLRDWPKDQGKYGPLRAAVRISDEESRYGDLADQKIRVGLDINDPAALLDPVVRLRRLLQSDLSSLGVVARGVCYPFRGE